MKHRAFLGIGPGRCGSMSLASILNHVENIIVFHEQYEYAAHMMDIFNSQYKETSEGDWGKPWYVGFIGMGWTRYARRIREDYFEDMPVICQHRPKDEVVASFKKVLMVPGRDPLSFGKAEVPSEEKIAEHWEFVEEIMSTITPPVLHLTHPNVLSTDSGLTQVYEFLSIPLNRRVYPKIRHINTREQQNEQKERRTAKDEQRRKRREPADIGAQAGEHEQSPGSISIVDAASEAGICERCGDVQCDRETRRGSERSGTCECVVRDSESDSRQSDITDDSRGWSASKRAQQQSKNHNSSGSSSGTDQIDVRR